MKALVYHTVSFSLVCFLAQSVQARFFEARSVCSRLYEIVFHMSSPFVLKLSDGNINAHFTHRVKINEVLFEMLPPFLPKESHTLSTSVLRGEA